MFFCCLVATRVVQRSPINFSKHLLTITWAPPLTTVEIVGYNQDMDIETLQLLVESKKCGNVSVKEMKKCDKGNRLFAIMNNEVGKCHL